MEYTGSITEDKFDTLLRKLDAIDPEVAAIRRNQDARFAAIQDQLETQIFAQAYILARLSPYGPHQALSSAESDLSLKQDLLCKRRLQGGCVEGQEGASTTGL